MQSRVNMRMSLKLERLAHPFRANNGMDASSTAPAPDIHSEGWHPKSCSRFAYSQPYAIPPSTGFCPHTTYLQQLSVLTYKRKRLHSHWPVGMDPCILHILPHFHQENIDLFLRPSQHPRKQRHAEALKTRRYILMIPHPFRSLKFGFLLHPSAGLTKLFDLLIFWPPIRRPFEDDLLAVGESNIFHLPLVRLRAITLSPSFATRFQD